MDGLEVLLMMNNKFKVKSQNSKAWMLNKEQIVQECDATEVKYLYFTLAHHHIIT